MSVARLTAVVSGQVQGVGFRDWTRRRATATGLVGSAVNRADGTVEVVAEGERPDLDRLVADLHGPRAPGTVTAIDLDWSDDVRHPTGFTTG